MTNTLYEYKPYQHFSKNIICIFWVQELNCVVFILKFVSRSKNYGFCMYDDLPNSDELTCISVSQLLDEMAYFRFNDNEIQVNIPLNTALEKIGIKGNWNVY